MISVIFPTYNEEGNVRELHRLNKETLDKMGLPYEIIVVDNGSEDKTLSILKELSPIKIISLTKNFGQTSALEIGINFAKGDMIVIMDGDIQNDPRDIPKLLSKLEEGYDVVSGWRKDRHDNFIRRAHSYLANWLTRKISGLNLRDHACALKIYRKDFLKQLRLYGVQHVFLAAQAYKLGARIAEVEVVHHARKHGLSKHHFFAGIKAIADLIMMRFLAPGTRPFVFFSAIGFWVWFLGIVNGVLGAMYGSYSFIIAALILAGLGFLLFVLGFISELLRRIYLELRSERPTLIKEIIER